MNLFMEYLFNYFAYNLRLQSLLQFQTSIYFYIQANNIFHNFIILQSFLKSYRFLNDLSNFLYTLCT